MSVSVNEKEAERIANIVKTIKYNRDYVEAWKLMKEYNIGFEYLMNSTVKIDIQDLISLVDINILNKSN